MKASRDSRLLERMLDCFVRMRTGTLSLVQGADDLMVLRDSLDSVEPRWAAEFTDRIATLDSAGMASAKQIRAMGSDYERAVSTALDDLESLVRDLMRG